MPDTSRSGRGDRSRLDETRLTDTGRVEAFSDGVFAIVITLLVLELRTPAHPEGGLIATLVHQWPAYLAYLASFLYVGVIWLNHHAAFTHIRSIDRGLHLANLRQQAIALGLGERFEQIEDMYAAANRILGNIVKVTPSSKVVGDLALHLVAVGADPKEFAEHPEKFDIPDSVIGFLAGELGTPPGGWPEPFRTKALAGRTVRPVQQDLGEDDRRELALRPRETLNRLLFPGPTREFLESRAAYGELSVLPTREFLYGLQPGDEHVVDIDPGKRLFAGLEAIGEPDERGYRTVMCTLNGQLRPVAVRDRSVASEVPVTEKADASRPGHIAAPFGGVVTLAVACGDAVEAGQTVATIEAMKMEASITTPVAGVVERLALGKISQVEGGDLLLVVST